MSSNVKSKVKGMSNYAKGVIAGIVSAMGFGFIPVFSKPMLADGMATECVLFYRFFLSAIMMAIYLMATHRRIAVGWRYAPSMFVEAIFYSFSGGLLMFGYNYMTGGVTTVIHFTYPVFVMAISLIFFRERIKGASVLSIVIALAGIYCLSVLGGDASFVPGANKVIGVIIVVLSGLACGCYIVGVNRTRAHELPSLVFTFWLLLISSMFFLGISAYNGTLEFITTPKQCLCFVGLTLIATILSNITLVFSARYVGSTLAAILGAVEPTTAVLMCILLFGETLNAWIVTGIVLVFTAVIIVVKRSR